MYLALHTLCSLRASRPAVKVLLYLTIKIKYGEAEGTLKPKLHTYLAMFSIVGRTAEAVHLLTRRSCSFLSSRQGRTFGMSTLAGLVLCARCQVPKAKEALLLPARPASRQSPHSESGTSPLDSRSSATTFIASRGAQQARSARRKAGRVDTPQTTQVLALQWVIGVV